MFDGDGMTSYLNARPSLVWRPRLLALAAFLAAAVQYMPNSRVLRSCATNIWDLGDFLLGSALACLAAALACFAKSCRNTAWAGPSARACKVAALLYCVVQVAWLALLPVGFPRPVALAAGVVSGMAVVPVVFAWVRAYSMDLRNVMLYGAVSCAGSALLTWVVSLLPASAVTWAFAVLACVGSIVPVGFFWSGRAARGGGEPALESKTAAGRDAGRSQEGGANSPSSGTGGLSVSLRSLLSIIWMPFLGLLVCVFITTAYTFPGAYGMRVTSELCGQLIASLIALVVCLVNFRTPLVILVDSIIVPACVGVSLVLGSFPDWSLGFVLGALSVLAPLVFMAIYALSSLVVVSAAGEFPVPFVVGAVLVTSMLATLAGAGLSFVAPDGANLGDVSWTILCAFFSMVLIGQGVHSWRRATAGDDVSETERIGDVAARGESVEELLARRVEGLSRGHGLTARESQVLGYLARGFDSTYIAKVLVISSNTVRSHMRNIYRKLGVGSRAELRELVWKQDEADDGH